MSDSDASSDAHHRIPRGASDEEIDSDCFSSDDDDVGSVPASTSAPASAPALRFDENGLLIESAGGGGARGKRAAISAVSAMLRPRGEEEDGEDEVPSSSSDDEEDGEGDGEVGDDLLAAATGRKDFAARARQRRESKRARAGAKDVTGSAGVGDEGPLRAHRGGEEGGHADMLQRIVGVLEEGRGGAGMGEIKKRIGRVAAAAAVDAPLPAVVANRVGRKVAFEKTVEEVAKWSGVVKKMRNTKQLVFPLNEPGGAAVRTSRDVGERLKPVNKFEEEVADLLKEAGVVTEDGVLKAEEAALLEQTGKVTKEELLARRRELAKIRSAVFENDRKFRRIKKIKSRKFRKAMKTEKERVADEARAAGVGSGDDESDDDLRAERERAEERMTLRHKNTSKWVRRQLARGETKRNPGVREAVEEQLRIGEELRRKMAGSDALGGGAESGSDQSGDEEDDERNIAELREELAGGKKPVRQKGLMGLKFMQDAQERRRQEAVGLLDELENEDDDDSDSGFDSDSRRGSGGDGTADKEGKKGVAGSEKVAHSVVLGSTKAGAAVGRRVFSGHMVGAATEGGNPEKGKLPHVSADGLVEKDSDDGSGDEEALENRIRSEYDNAPAGSGLSAKLKHRGGAPKDALALAASEVVTSDGQRGRTTTLDGRITVEVNSGNLKAESGKSSAPHSKVALPSVIRYDETRATSEPELPENPWLKPVETKRKRARGHALEIVDELVVALPKQKAVRKAGQANTMNSAGEPAAKKVRFSGAENGESTPTVAPPPAAAAVAVDMGDSDEDEDVSRMMVAARAFAGAGGADLADFEAMKQVEIEKSLPTAKDVGAVVLPGWGGGWAGDGAMDEKKKRGNNGKPVTTKPESAFAKAAREKLEAARAKAIAARVDGKHSHVIVSARRAKKAADLTMAAVPFPYTSAAQWEQEVAAPLVRERLTASSQAAALRPKVVVPRGEAVQPLRISIAAAADRKKADKSGAIQRRGRRAKQRDGERKSF